MKTVQEVLKELETEELINAYLERVPISTKLMMETEDKSAKDLLLYARGRVREYIDRLRTIPVDGCEETHILFAYETMKEYRENDYALVRLSDIRTKGLNSHSYAYEFSPQSEIVGYVVADTKRTQDDLIGLMTDVLYEASFFGFEQESLQEELDELDRRIKEVESPDFVGIPEEEVWKELGIEKEVRSEDENELEKIYNDALIKYNNFKYKKALREVMDSLGLKGIMA